jgi:hypothetical protein
MSSAFPGWVLDPARNQYYYYSTEENAYIFQNGERLFMNSTSQGSGPSAPLPSESGPRISSPASNAGELTESFSHMALSDRPSHDEYVQVGPSSGKLHSQQQCLNISLLLLTKHQIQWHLAIVQNP